MGGGVDVLPIPAGTTGFPRHLYFFTINRKGPGTSLNKGFLSVSPPAGNTVDSRGGLAVHLLVLGVPFLDHGTTKFQRLVREQSKFLSK